VPMIKRIAQRTKDDCKICVVAMVMAPPYTYERVLEDGREYPKSTPDGKFPAWWETYLRDTGIRLPLPPLQQSLCPPGLRR